MLVLIQQSTQKVITYFNTFPLMGMKYMQYLLWRKIYIKTLKKFNLTPLGVKCIINVKKRKYSAI